MKKLICLILCLTLVISSLSLSGCGKNSEEEEYLETTLSFDKDGRVRDVIIDSFSENYYSEAGLKAFFDEKISEYNSSNLDDEDVVLESLEVSDGKAKAILEFESADAYKAFYGASTFYGTVSEAYDNGYITEITMKALGSPETINKSDLMKMKDSKIIIVSEVVRVACPKKIQFVSANIEVIDEKTARVSSDSTGLAYILLK